MTTPHWQDKVFEDWWPLGQSMILVRVPFRRSATALQNQAYEWQCRTNAAHRFDWLRVSCLDESFRSVKTFTIGPLTYYALPTEGDWRAIWCNSFLCDEPATGRTIPEATTVLLGDLGSFLGVLRRGHPH